MSQPIFARSEVGSLDLHSAIYLYYSEYLKYSLSYKLQRFKVHSNCGFLDLGLFVTPELLMESNSLQDSGGLDFASG